MIDYGITRHSITITTYTLGKGLCRWKARPTTPNREWCSNGLVVRVDSMLKWQELLRERSLKRIQQAAVLVPFRLDQAKSGERERGYKVRRDPPPLSDPFPLEILKFPE